MAKKQYKALEPMHIGRDIRPGDVFEAEPAEVAGKDVVELGAPSGGLNVPTDEAERLAVIVAAIGLLDTADAALWLKNGAPKTEAIAEVIGWQLSAKERDAAWAQINAGK